MASLGTGGLAVELQVALLLLAGLFCLFRVHAACKNRLKQPPLTILLLLVTG